MRKLNALIRDERGTSVIELAMVAPLLATFIIGMVDLSNGYSARLQLEQAAQRSIEKVMQTSGNLTLYDALKAEGAVAAGVPVTAVTVDYWLECNGTRQSSYGTTCTTGQSYARYLEVSIVKEYQPSFGLSFMGEESNGKYLLTGTAGIRTQ